MVRCLWIASESKECSSPSRFISLQAFLDKEIFIEGWGLVSQHKERKAISVLEQYLIDGRIGEAFAMTVMLYHAMGVQRGHDCALV